jgi:response regulator of citrate/malate metabolism
MTILYIEDDLLVSKLAITVFEKLDHNVLWCQGIGCGKKAIAEGGKFDLILLDMRLADGDGLDFLEFLDKTNSKIPVIIVSALADHYSSSIEEFKKKGIVIAVYSKPLNFKGFVADINAMFAHRC